MLVTRWVLRRGQRHVRGEADVNPPDGGLGGVVCKVGGAGGSRDVAVAEKLADHRQALPEGERSRGEVCRRS